MNDEQTRTHLEQQLDGVEEQFAEIYATHVDGSEELDDALYDAQYGIAEERIVTILFAGGGPTIQATAYVRDGNISDPKLVGTWGGQKISRPIPAESPLFQALCHYMTEHTSPSPRLPW